MGYVLGSEERKLLKERHKREKNKSVADRIKVVILMDEGWTYENVATALLIDESTTRRHFEIYEKEERLKGNHKGSSPLLDNDESAKLEKHLEENIHTKIKDIRVYIQVHFHKTMSASAVRNWLKKHKFSYKKPVLTPANVDSTAQKEFIQMYETLMNEAARNGEEVLFGDAVHPSQQTRPSYGWFKIKGTKSLEVKAGRKRINIVGFHNLATTTFHFQEYETVNGENIVKALQFLEKKYPDSAKIHLILDRAGYHRCKEVEMFLENSKIQIYFLPPRSPNLNPIEQLWKIMHAYVSNNRTYEKFQDFKKALFDFFNITMKNHEVINYYRLKPVVWNTLAKQIKGEV